MKRFFIRLLVFMAIMFVLDRGFGLAMKYLQGHAKGGYVKHHNYITHQAIEDIIIFGSSRAIHHYNPQIIKNSFGMSCYNCGQDGNGIILYYGWWQIIKERYSPKIIIYDLTPEYDFLRWEDNSKYLGWLRSEYDNDNVKSLFDAIDSTERYKMLSMMYRNNSKFLQNITDFFHPLFEISEDGYLPLEGELDKLKIDEVKNAQKQFTDIDSVKIKYLESLIRETKIHDVKLIFVASPIWYGMNEIAFQPVRRLCEDNHVVFLDYSNDSAFVRKDSMFKDGGHLNAHGADVFTLKLSKDLSVIFK